MKREDLHYCFSEKQNHMENSYCPQKYRRQIRFNTWVRAENNIQESICLTKLALKYLLFSFGVLSITFYLIQQEVNISLII